MADTKFSQLPVVEGKVQAAGLKDGKNVLVQVEDTSDKYFSTYLSAETTVAANAVEVLPLVNRLFRNGLYRITVTLYAVGVDDLSTFRFVGEEDPRQYALSDEANTLIYTTPITTKSLNLSVEIAAGLQDIILNTYTGVLVERLEEL